MTVEMIEKWQKAKSAVFSTEVRAGDLPKGIRGYALVAVLDDGEVTYGAMFPVSASEGKEMANWLRYMAKDIVTTTSSDRFTKVRE